MPKRRREPGRAWRFVLVPSKRFEDDFRALPKRVQGQVLKALERVRLNPHRGRKLRGLEIGRWRDRVGDYRIRYDIEGTSILLLLTVRLRKEVLSP